MDPEITPSLTGSIRQLKTILEPLSLAEKMLVLSELTATELKKSYEETPEVGKDPAKFINQYMGVLAESLIGALDPTTFEKIKNIEVQM